jgi:hypothetical protein
MAHKDVVGKLKLDLVPPRSLEAIALVREFGNDKYSKIAISKGLDPIKENIAWGWRDQKQVTIPQLAVAIKRHQNDIDRGIFFDKESGHPHWYHIACDAAMICEIYMLEKEKLDTTPKE